MVTVLDIVTDAMQESGILTKNETPTNDEAQAGLKMLNRLVGSWSNSSVIQFERVTESFALTGVASYTIGSGGDFDTVRPSKIIEAHVRQGNTDYPLSMISDSIYQSISNKSTGGGISEFLNYTNEYPLATINLYPIPSSVNTLFITSEKPLTSYASISTTVNLPSGWQDALTYNLAVRLGRLYGQPTDPELTALARETKALISLNAIKNNPLQSQATMATNVNNIYSGYGS